MDVVVYINLSKTKSLLLVIRPGVVGNSAAEECQNSCVVVL
jgi:hypothetical protein